MSREIKFRFWNKLLKQYEREALPDDSYKYGFGLEDVGFFYDDDTKNDYIVEQYTGLKDKNGREIYEGDIIKMPPELCYEQDETTGVVEFSHGSFYVKDKQFIDGTKHVVDFYDFNDPEVEFEVIGNIHENPELLNDGNGKQV